MKNILITLSFLYLSACAFSVHQVTISENEVDTKTAKKIQAEAQDLVILGFTTETNYANVAYNQLIEKCPKGRISGVSARYSTALGFYSWTNKILLTGYCHQ